MDGGSLTSSATTSDYGSIDSLQQLHNCHLDGSTESGNVNDRLCTALLWSAKIAAKSQQKQAFTSKNRKLNWKNPALYKTRLCDYWSTGNPCKFGLNCWYAHGPVELRHVPRLDKDPVATSISLAEVVQKLPPSRDRSIALEQAENQLIANIKSDAFVKHAVKEFTGPTPPPTSAPAEAKSPTFFTSPPASPHRKAEEKTKNISRLPFFEQMTAKANNLTEFRPSCFEESLRNGMTETHGSKPEAVTDLRQSYEDEYGEKLATEMAENAFHAYQPYLDGFGSAFSQTSSSPLPPLSLYEDPRWRF